MDIGDDYIKQHDAALGDIRPERAADSGRDRRPVDSAPAFLRPDIDRHVDLLRYRC